MKLSNIYEPTDPKLGVHSDSRGTIADIFYNANINHACLITSAPDAVRGNHYHKLTTQYTFITKGVCEYWSQPSDLSSPATMKLLVPGDFAISEPYEIHTMRMGKEGCDMIAFASGPRGGEDYESDTFRVATIIPTDE
jgi:hypothetical protein